MNLHGIPAILNFFETGHGKGPCDGIGGTAKRTADLTIKQGKICVQDANDFYNHVQTIHTSAKYISISTADIDNIRQTLAQMNKDIVIAKGTMKIHQVVGVSKGNILSTPVSCYCERCLDGQFHDYTENNLLKKTSLIRNDESENVVEEEERNQPIYDNAETAPAEQIEHENPDQQTDKVESEAERVVNDIGDWVLARYDEELYVGQVKYEDLEYEVSFLR